MVKTENREQRTENREQRTENREQNKTLRLLARQGYETETAGDLK
jgi:hypothetical protein